MLAEILEVLHIEALVLGWMEYYLHDYGRLDGTQRNSSDKNKTLGCILTLLYGSCEPSQGSPSSVML